MKTNNSSISPKVSSKVEEKKTEEAVFVIAPDGSVFRVNSIKELARDARAYRDYIKR
jgi:hypothetical protein